MKAIKESLSRIKQLTIKEFKQLFRDKSNLLLGIGLPIILIFIFGYGISFDINNVNIGVVDYDRSETTHNIKANINGSKYFTVIDLKSIQEAEIYFDQQKIEGFIEIPNDFTANIQKNNAKINIILNGIDTNRAQNILSYLQQTVAQAQTKYQSNSSSPIGVQVISNMRYNSAQISRWYLIPGLIVLIITLIGTFLTSLVMAREWERGTLEAIFVTPIHPIEILVGKITPYFCVGLLGLSLCMLAAKLLFGIPLHGSLILLYIFSMLYLLITLCIGLLISILTKNQFVASQLAVFSSFLPCLMLSEFIFDLRNVPDIINIIGHCLPAIYYLKIIKSLYLAGNIEILMLKNGLVLLGFAFILVTLTLKLTKKSLE